MYKYLLLAGASLLLATATTNVMAGTAPVLSYMIAPASGSVKVTGADETIGGGMKLWTDSASGKNLIAVALGINPDDKAEVKAISKDYVLALAVSNGEGCGGEVVVWDKGTSSVVGELATIGKNDCESGVNSFPDTGKNGTEKGYQAAELDFIQSSCYGAPSGVNGQGGSLINYTAKVTAANTENESESLQNVSITSLLANISAFDGNVVVVGGSFKASFSKPLNANYNGTLALDNYSGTCPAAQ